MLYFLRFTIVLCSPYMPLEADITTSFRLAVYTSLILVLLYRLLLNLIIHKQILPPSTSIPLQFLLHWFNISSVEINKHMMVYFLINIWFFAVGTLLNHNFSSPHCTQYYNSIKSGKIVLNKRSMVLVTEKHISIICTLKLISLPTSRANVGDCWFFWCWFFNNSSRLHSYYFLHF